MAIKKQDFYEGAALYQLIKKPENITIRYVPPFFLVNENRAIYLKYSTKVRSPWGFTFSLEERNLLEKKNSLFSVVIGLICGSDGVAAIDCDSLGSISVSSDNAFRIACHRRYNEHYKVKGPDGRLRQKVAPSDWLRILDR